MFRKILFSLLCAASFPALAGDAVFPLPGDWCDSENLFKTSENGVFKVTGPCSSTLFFKIDPEKTYAVTGMAKGEFKLNVTFACFDKSFRSIGPNQVCVSDGTFTEILDPVSEGSSLLHVKNAANWRRGPVVLHAKEDLSDLPNFDLLAHMKSKEQLPDGTWNVSLSGSAIRDIPANTPVRLHYGYTYVSKEFPTGADWTPFRFEVSGFSEKGMSAKHFPAGTKYIKVSLSPAKWGVPVLIRDIRLTDEVSAPAN